MTSTYSRVLASSLLLDAYEAPPVGLMGRINILLRESEGDTVGNQCHRMEMDLRRELKKHDLPEEVKGRVLNRMRHFLNRK